MEIIWKSRAELEKEQGMADEVKTEEPRIEPYYQGQGKFLTDTLFDLGCLSESLSRDGLTKVEDLAALMFQQIADSASRCSGFTKKYKKSGHDEGEWVRHEEEMRWIERAKEAEHEVLKQWSETLAQQEEIERHKALYTREERADAAWAWSREVVAFLRKIVVPWPEADSIRAQDEVALAAQLLNKAFELEIAKPDCRPGKEWEVRPGDLSQEKFRPGAIHRVSNVGEPEPGVCPKCGLKKRCESMHGFTRCQKPEGHEGTHQHRDGRHIEEWG